MNAIKTCFAGMVSLTALAGAAWTGHWAYVWFSDPVTLAGGEVVMLIASLLCLLLLGLSIIWMDDLRRDRKKLPSREMFFSDPETDWRQSP